MLDLVRELKKNCEIKVMVILIIVGTQFLKPVMESRETGDKCRNEEYSDQNSD